MKIERRKRLSVHALVCALCLAVLPPASLATAQQQQQQPQQQRQRRTTDQNQQNSRQTPRATPTPTPQPSPLPSAQPSATPSPVSSPAVAPASAIVTSSPDELRLRLREVLDQQQLASSFAAVKIVSLDTGRTLFEENAGKLLNPASNMKLFTVAAALARLSPDFRITTSVYAPARPDAAGTINGDLRIYGRGDPTYAARFTKTDARAAIDDLAARIQTAGVRRVAGDLVADESYFAGASLGRGWEWDDLQWYYGAEVSALTVGDNSIELNVRPGAEPGATCFVTTTSLNAPLVTIINQSIVAPPTFSTSTSVRGEGDMLTPTVATAAVQTATQTPPGSILSIVNRATTSPRGTKRELRVFRPLGSHVIEVSGTLPQGDAGFTGSLAAPRPALLFAHMLRDALQKRGVAVGGSVRAVSRENGDFQSVPLASLAEIASRQSPPLNVIARETMKPSQNLYTELLLRQLAAPPANAQPAAGITAEAGLDGLRAFLRAAGIEDGSVVSVDGSGLSRGDFVTADAVVRLLTYMDKHPYRAAFRDTLPIAGVDGTLRNRLKGTRAAGNVLAKTGTLSTATSLSGYLTSRSGERLVFALIINNYADDLDPRARFTDPIAVLLAEFAGRS